jgi:Zn finger protein HypA/HybF involved in hydrogenase expression
MPGRRSWTDEMLRNAVEASFSCAATLRALGLRPRGSNYASIKRRIADLSLETSHWTGQAHLRGKPNLHVVRRPLQELLRKGTRFASGKLRRRLISAGLFEPRCQSCGLSEWAGEPIPLELDHIDGDTENNELQDLRVICPNCHAQTPTYRGRNTRYAHIPQVDEILKGIERCGGVRAYATERGVSPGAVRDWLRPERLRRLSKGIHRAGS